MYFSRQEYNTATKNSKTQYRAEIIPCLRNLELYLVPSHSVVQVMLIMKHAVWKGKATPLYDEHEPLSIYHHIKLHGKVFILEPINL